MAKSKQQKKHIVELLKNKIKQAKSIIFVSFNQLGVKDNESLRNELKKENSEYYVAKKTLLKVAFKDNSPEEMKIDQYRGQVAAIFAFNDEVAPAKIIDKFKKETKDKIIYLGGILEDKFITSSEVDKLAQIPSKPELYAKLVGSINAPISSFVNVLAGNLRNLIYVLSAVKESKE